MFHVIPTFRVHVHWSPVEGRAEWPNGRGEMSLTLRVSENELEGFLRVCTFNNCDRIEAVKEDLP